LAKRQRAGRRRRRIVHAFIILPAAVVLASVTVVAAMRWVPPPTTAFIMRWTIAHGRAPAQLWVPWSRISPEMALAVVAAEDQNFPLHAGFDFGAIEDAMEERRTRGRLRGASTITQQVAKNLFLWSERSWLRKGFEAWFTIWIELLWSKRRILETYLNIAELGEGVFGVEAASRLYFGKSAASIDPYEAALLASVLPNPIRLSAARPSAYVEERRGWILWQMKRLGGRSYLASLGV
jgi:monofunctional biosynthetic peptidoglycan transglycosylase